MKVSFLGLTHLGIVYFCASRIRGFDPIGVDPRIDIVNKLNAGVAPIFEPGINDVIQECSEQRFYTDYEMLRGSDIIFISSDVATDGNGDGDLRPIVDAVKTVSQINREAIVVILSQVRPGFCDEMRSIFHLNIFYQVETLTFGIALDCAVNPARIILGAKDQSVPDLLMGFYGTGCELIPVSLKTAELTKICINIFLISQVTTTNILARIAELLGADWEGIEASLRLDKRIGRHAYLRPGLGLSGGNLERDLRSIEVLSVESGLGGSFWSVIRELNANSKEWIINELNSFHKSQRKDKLEIALVGMSYKPNTNSVKNSASVDLLSTFENGFFYIFDPHVDVSILPVNDNWAQAKALEDCVIYGCDVLIIMHDLGDQALITRAVELAVSNGIPMVLDPLRNLDNVATGRLNCVRQIGRG